MKYLDRLALKNIALLGLLMLVGCQEELPVGRMPPTLSLDKPAPDFVFETLASAEKKTAQLTHYRGKVVYLDFWASWCKPCITSMPMLDRLRVELKGQGFEVLAVNMDENIELGEAFLLKYPVSYPVIHVPGDTISALYQVYGLPTSYIIDRQGVLRYVHQGFRDGDMEIIRKQILLLLK